MKYVLFLGLLFTNVFANDQIEKLNWGGLEVVYIKDTSPLYSVKIYFADGALSDGLDKGITNAMFSMLTSGTRRFSRKDILENLEYYGADFGPYVTHEYSTYSVSGLSKDVLPTMKKICHLFDDTVFLKQEIKKEKVRAIDSVNNMVRSPESLASRIFRELSLEGTEYAYPVSGKLKDIKSITQSKLKKKLDYFKNKVFKKIYISGPPAVLGLESVFTNDCKWKSNKTDFVRSKSLKIKKREKKHYLITMPKGNQTQIRMGRILNHNEIKDEASMDLASGFLGGGFSSILVKEVRVKRGLTYSVSAFAVGQKDYGRSGVSTFTKNETVYDTIKVINDTIRNVMKGEFEEEAFKRARSYLVGSYPFRLEKSGNLLGEIIALDHAGKSYDNIFKYKDLMSSKSKADLIKTVQDLFDLEQMTYLMLGNEDMSKTLKEKFPGLIVKSYEDFL